MSTETYKLLITITTHIKADIRREFATSPALCSTSQVVEFDSDDARNCAIKATKEAYCNAFTNEYGGSYAVCVKL